VPSSWRAAITGWVEPHAAAKMTEADVAWADVIVGVQESHRKAAVELRRDARVVVERVVDPAFRPVSEWPDLARKIVALAPSVAARIEGSFSGED